jgi:hypothetical protein
MQPIEELLQRLKADHPDITFVLGDTFKWSGTSKELTIATSGIQGVYILHELAHALLEHTDFSWDVDLLRQEREAWGLVRKALAPRYGVAYDAIIIEDSLDTYREWLHARSLCPTCGLTGLQTKTSTYVCINCRCSWRPNDARQCALRRYKLAN